MQEKVISISDIAKHYQVGTQLVKAIRTISIDIYKNEYVALMGPSGSGKSTLMNILGCLDTPTRGEYLLAGQDVSKMIDAFNSNDIEAAEEMHQKMLPLIESMFCETNPAPLKEAMEMLNMCSSSLRLPMWHITEKSQSKVRQALKDYGLL